MRPVEGLRGTAMVTKGIVHGYFTDAADRETMTRAIRILADIAAQPALTAHRRADLRVPASDSDADIWEFIKRECQTLYHPTSTCAIGSTRSYGCSAWRGCGWWTPPSCRR